MEYRIAQGWRIFVIVFATVFFIGGIFCLWQGFKPDTNWPAGLALLIAVFLMGLAVIFYLDTMRTLVTVDRDIISVVRLFRCQSALLAEIDGYRKGEKDTFFVILKDSAKSISIPQNIERRKELLDWIMEKYEDVDARERLKETGVLLENEQFGLTKEDRKARLELAKKVDMIATVAGMGSILSLLLLHQYFETVMIVLLIAPWVGVFATWYFKGLLKLYKGKRSPYPSAVLLMFLSTVSALMGVLSYHLYGFEQKAWSILIGGTILAALICSAACHRAIAGSGRKAFTYICIVVVAGVYSYALEIFSNCNYDESPAKTFQVEVSHKHKKSGKSTTYYLSLSSWGRFEDGHEVSVSQSLYQSVKVGDSIKVLLNNGKWGVPWYRLKQ
jgi:hypothetical protein